jgi:hypothetical protein
MSESPTPATITGSTMSGIPEVDKRLATAWLSLRMSIPVFAALISIPKHRFHLREDMFYWHGQDGSYALSVLRGYAGDDAGGMDTH